MANDNYPRLMPLKPPGTQTVPANYYRVSTAADIFLGQPVAIAAAGYVVGIGTPTAATTVLGVAIGFAGVNQRGLATNDPYLDISDLTPPDPSSDTGDRYVLVSDDPSQEYLVQEDTGGTALTNAEIGASIDLIYRGAVGSAVNGNTDTGWANIEIDASSVVTTTAAFAQLLRVHNAINQDGTENAPGDYGKWVIKFLNPQKAGAGLTPIV